MDTQNPTDLDWLRYFEDEPPLLEEVCNPSFEAFDPTKVPPLKQDEHCISELEFQDFSSIEDISQWDWWVDSLSWLRYNDNGYESYATIGEDDSTTAATAADHGGLKEARRSKTLELEEIQKHFHMPITMAAKKLRVGLTVLKKRCRQLNIKRWPHRKLKSLQSLIQNVKELGLKKEIEMLEEHKRMMEDMPEIELTERTKKLRQACFKANYKRRRLFTTLDSPHCPSLFHYP